jgi:aminopeptidase-like protein
VQTFRTIEIDDTQAVAAGTAMLDLMHHLYPLCRSITGPGLRETLRRIGNVIPLTTTDVPTGTRIFDWIVPREWAIEEAYLEHDSGRRFVDFRDHNLHVVNYSVPVDTWLQLSELRPRLHTLPQHPDWIPFRSSYYREDWGFCLSDRVRQSLPDGSYHAVIRSRLFDGALTLGEFVQRGKSDDEILIFAHTCHPSLCNDNLSGIVVATQLAAFLAGHATRYTYRFVFAPATIGSIAWMATNESKLAKIRHGLVLAMLGDAAPLHYQKTLSGSAAIDRAVGTVLRSGYPDAAMLEFSPWGFDERQFNTPGIKLPVGRLTRTLTGQYPQEHTSADSFEFVSARALGDAWRACLRIFEVLECDERYINLAPKGEPQLGRRGLYRQTGGYYESVPDRHLALLWILNQSDGSAGLLDIAERSGLDFGLIAQCARDLQAAGLLELA